ncbi:MAG: DsbA family protein, partial [Candidatus Aenigmatarchaeota archaeon]
KEETLLKLAEEVGLNVEKFKRDLDSEGAREEFQKDRNFARSYGATGFPTFLIEREKEEVWLRGYHPFRDFQDSLEQLDPNLKCRKPGSIPEFVKKYNHVATREVQEVFEMERGDALKELKNLEDGGEIKSVEMGNGYFWEPRKS